MSATRNSNRIQRGKHSERTNKVAATLFLLMGLASASCTPKCTFDSNKVNFDYKVEYINNEYYYHYKPRSTHPVADAISFTSADIRPTNAGTGGCPNSFKTLSFTYPGGKGFALGVSGSYKRSFLSIVKTHNAQVETEWWFHVNWGTQYDNNVLDPYRHPILAVMLLIGWNDNVIYASKMVYFTRTSVTGFSE